MKASLFLGAAFAATASAAAIEIRQGAQPTKIPDGELFTLLHVTARL
jgi:hypothetical protein